MLPHPSSRSPSLTHTHITRCGKVLLPYQVSPTSLPLTHVTHPDLLMPYPSLSSPFTRCRQVLLPYQVSFMSLFEFYRMEVQPLDNPLSIPPLYPLSSA